MDLGAYRKKYPHDDVEIYVMATVGDFKHFIQAHIDDVRQGLTFTLDLQNGYAQQYHITESPAFILIKDGISYRMKGAWALSTWMEGHDV